MNGSVIAKEAMIVILRGEEISFVFLHCVSQFKISDCY